MLLSGCHRFSLQICKCSFGVGEGEKDTKYGEDGEVGKARGRGWRRPAVEAVVVVWVAVSLQVCEWHQRREPWKRCRGGEGQEMETNEKGG